MDKLEMILIQRIYEDYSILHCKINAFENIKFKDIPEHVQSLDTLALEVREELRELLKHIEKNIKERNV
jgi:hypothetical protein